MRRTNCRTCGDILTDDNVYSDRPGYYRPDCRKCSNKIHAARVASPEGKEKRNNSRRKHYAINREKFQEAARNRNKLPKVKEYQRNYDLLRNYGITTGQYESMVHAQGGCCKICLQTFLPLEVDHCHETGKIRGLLCESCNLGLGKFKDNVEFLKAAVIYLEPANAN